MCGEREGQTESDEKGMAWLSDREVDRVHGRNGRRKASRIRQKD